MTDPLTREQLEDALKAELVSEVDFDDVCLTALHYLDRLAETERIARLRQEEISDFVRALDLHKQRIRLLQEALCECQQRDLFQAGLHDETCPVYEATRPEREEPT